ncbi:plasmid segregation protein ParM (plasmid) [Arsenophonus nasoniae]|uniref:Plasmid segregation protein ParM n=1 Tax=Arsenophonus nasoniae TaxID=638 RepID=A0A4P7L2C5_9GAMM|nr:plasmid segregation protein ParM domain-containing protein [Arsenophonus nasoniae]QBY46711.1 Plasmid segregation protein ParM [Arsenophonus nasoniae]QBY46805.1 Plasmid segregation protein ParM [Arsenophonus nasoniae]WGM08777.1 plasmid segregation protein ParM [Arsenophonus nasoniae]WGM13561.1 plasmid segregation protein ParM [Arsenophonus nasoniae]WGM18162.1 plasmid segregation protein ParM [Arsenophonus nasoniae]
MKVYCDDGSTATKLAWIEDGKIKLFVLQNGFVEKWKNNTFGEVHNYIVNGKKYSYSPNSDEIISTTNINYQYRPINTLGIQEALQQSGLKPQEIDLVVTLPITEYYNTDAQENKENIRKKINNLKEKVELNNGDVFTFNDIKVLPESIPSVAPILSIDNVQERELSLVVDLGGTTLDCGLIRGVFNDVIKTTGNQNLGVGQIIKQVQNALMMADTELNFNDTDSLIRDMVKNRNIAQYINNKSMISHVKKALEMAMMQLSDSVIGHIEENYKSFHRIYLTGGGAEFLLSPFKKHWHVLGDKVKKIDEPQTALVKALGALDSEDN